MRTHHRCDPSEDFVVNWLLCGTTLSVAPRPIRPSVRALGLPDCCIVNTGDFLTCHSAKIRRQESRAVARKPRDIAGVLGLNFAIIIHYRCKVTMVGLICKDSKVLTTNE